MHRLHRRTVLASLLGAAAMPSVAFAAGETAFDAVAERAGALDQLHSLTIVHRGETRYARAFRGPGLERPVNVKSVSKSIVALLAGIAIDRGLLPGTDATLGDLTPELVPAGADSKVGDITIGNLLTMQAGLERTSGPNYGAWVSSADWVRYVLTRPFEAEPGERFQYSTGSYHVLGAVLARVADRSLLALAREWLGEPLGITFSPWEQDPQGYYLGGNNMVLSPSAMARIGEMVRSGGTLDGVEVVSADWIEASMRPRTRSPFSGDLYGYGWFVTEFAGTPLVYARGYGGQMIYVIADLELTIAVTSDPTRPARTEGHAGDLHDLVEEAIIPALTS